MRTGDNDRFVRFWFEVSKDNILFDATTSDQTIDSPKYWVPYQSGGSFRKWYGNAEKVVYWKDNGRAIKEATIEKYPALDWDNLGWKITNEEHYFKPGITWSAVSSETAFRYYEKGYIFSNAGQSLIPSESKIGPILGFLNSRVVDYLRPVLSPKIGLEAGYVAKLPYCSIDFDNDLPTRCIEIAKTDWESREISWSFKESAILPNDDRSRRIVSNEIDDGSKSFQSRYRVTERLSVAAEAYMQSSKRTLEELHLLEEENNRRFIRHFGLEDTLNSDVSYSDITILQDEFEPKARKRGELVFNLAEMIAQFVSYGVGCIFGRYSLDKDGLILANAGDDLDTYLSQIPEPTLRPDESGILPITDDNDFSDDLSSQWRAFLRAAFGDEHYEENLRFLEDGLGKRLRPYFLKGFYDDHVKRYKKRPIYWLITSPKGTLQALIYLHRYNRDTVNRFLNDYLRPYQQKLEAKRVSAEHVLTGGGSSQSEKTKAQKRIDEIRKALEELSTWERDVVRPLAEKRIELDLDDGVKVNYGKLGAILAKVKGLNG